jgi:hypothetical protein
MSMRRRRRSKTWLKTRFRGGRGARFGVDEEEEETDSDSLGEEEEGVGCI